MKHSLWLLLSLGLLSQLELAQGDDSKRTLFSDDFSANELSKDWRLYKAVSIVEDRVLIGKELPGGGHAAVHSFRTDPFGDAELQVDLKFEGSRATSLAFNQQGFTDSHAGHICRVSISPKKLTLKDGKTGVFQKDIYKKRKAGQVDAATKELLKTKEASFPVNIVEGTWVQVKVQIEGDLMQAFIDGKLIGSLRSEGIAHETKDKVALVTPKQAVHYDNVSLTVPVHK